MKKLLLVLGIAIGFSSLYNEAQAQHVSINININSQPAWGPVGYDYVDYYYFPDINVYYHVNSGRYHYLDRGRWIVSRYLPGIYANYDLYGLYKVVLNVNNPWKYNSRHRRDYRRYVGYRGQVVIRDSRDARYYNSRRNHVSWYSDKHRPNNGRNHVSRPSQNWNNNKRDYNYNQKDYNKNYNNKNNNRDKNKDNRDKNRPNRNQNNNVNKDNNRSNSRSNSSRPSYNNNSRSQSNNKGRSESSSRERNRSSSNSNARVYSVNR